MAHLIIRPSLAILMAGAAPWFAQHGTAAPPAAASADPAGLYSPSSLIEVRKFADLPVGVTTLARGSLTAKSDNTDPVFLAGGASDSSAIFAYEAFGYIPSCQARAYVHSNGVWQEVRIWNDIAPVHNLNALLAATR